MAMETNAVNRPRGRLMVLTSRNTVNHCRNVSSKTLSAEKYTRVTKVAIKVKHSVLPCGCKILAGIFGVLVAE